MKTNAKIYVMRAADGTIKLGHSRNPLERAKQVGRPVEVVHMTDVLEQVEKIERLAHRVLALHGRHIRGEWFEATLADALTAIEIAMRQAENTELALGGRLGIARPQTRLVVLRLDDVTIRAIDDIRAMSRPIPTISDVIRDAVMRDLQRIRREDRPASGIDPGPAARSVR